MDHGRWWIAGVVSLAATMGVAVYATEDERRPPSVEIRREPGTLPQTRDREVRSQRPRGRIGSSPETAPAVPTQGAAPRRTDAGPTAKAAAPAVHAAVTDRWLPAGFQLGVWELDRLRALAGLERWIAIQPYPGSERTMADASASMPEMRQIRAHYSSYRQACRVLCEGGWR